MVDRLVERSFPADPAEVPGVVRLVAELAAESGLEAERRQLVELATEEAAQNLCSYAYRAGQGEILVRVIEEPDRFVVELEDEGTPFDPLQVEEPDLALPLAERPVGGLGVFLIRRTMDEVHYRRDGGRNVLTLVMRRRR